MKLVSLMVVKYILNRLLWFIPVLFFVMLLLFFLDQKTTQDQFFQATITERQSQGIIDDEGNLLADMASEKGWDLPPFYFTLTHRGWSPDFYSEISPKKRELINEIGTLTLDSWRTGQIVEQVESIFESYNFLNVDDKWKTSFLTFYRSGQFSDLWNWVLNLQLQEIDNEHLVALATDIQSAQNSRTITHALPVLAWHGKVNRFHHFFIDFFLSGHKKSSVDGKQIYEKIWPAAGITLFINIIALLIILLISIPLGMYLFAHSGKISERMIRVVLYVLFALPLFWLATMVLSIGGWIPGSLLTGTPELRSGEIPSLLTFLRPVNWSYLLLPIISIALGLLAVITIQMFRALKETGEEKFILAAHSRGLQPGYVIKKHNRPVAFYSILTMIGNSIPSLISGSVVIEIIFNIPGMGRLLWQALYAFDWSIVTGILIVGVVFSIVGQLLTDLAYYYMNPVMRASS